MKIPAKVLELIRIFQNAGYKIYVVGGSSRALLTNTFLPYVDWDFATNATPPEMLKLFPKNSFYENEFGTVSMVMGKGKNNVFEVTTFRKEQGYTDNRHPDKVVWGKTIEEDLSRRDFTINAIAISITSNLHPPAGGPTSNKFKITDPFKGQKDLSAKVIRCVGNPDDRFSEDALRLMRAVRIATQLQFSIEEKTFASLRKNAAKIKNIAWERINTELFKLLASEHPADGIILLYTSGLLDFIIPELTVGKNVAQNKHHVHDVWTHNLETLRFCSAKDPLVRLAALLHDIGKPATAKGEGINRSFHSHEVVGAAIAKKIGLRLRLSNKQIDKLWRLVRWHQFTPSENQTDSAIRRFIRRVGVENLQDILDVRTGDRLGSGVPKTSWRTELFKKRLVEVQKQPFAIKDLKVNGHDVMEILKTKPGPKIGEILETLFKEVEEDITKNEREYLLKRIKDFSF